MSDHLSEDSDQRPDAFHLFKQVDFVSSTSPRRIRKAQRKLLFGITSFLESEGSEGAKLCTLRKNEIDTKVTGMSSDISVYNNSSVNSNTSFLFPSTGQTKFNMSDSSSMDTNKSFLFPCTGQTKFNMFDSSSMDTNTSFLFPCTGQTKLNKFDNTANTGIFSFSTEFEIDSSQAESNRTVFQFRSPSKSYSDVNEGRHIWQRYQRTSYWKKCWNRTPKGLRLSSAFCSTQTKSLSCESKADVCSTPTPVGNALKFNAPTGVDVCQLGGKSVNINTRKQCITCMREYGNKSLEELRVEHYAGNRKSAQGGRFEGFVDRCQRGVSFISSQTATALSFGASSPSETNFKFVPRTAYEITFNEGNVHQRRIRFQSITFMEEYSDKSFEELRMDEYVAGHKSSQHKINSSEDNSEEKKFFGTTNFASNPKSFQRKMFDFNKNTQIGFFGVPNSSSVFDFVPTQAKSFFGDTSIETTQIFRPPEGTDTMMKGGVQTNTKTRLQCITCMFEYEGKSLEELRLEDYQANRKGLQYKTCDYDKSKETGFFGKSNSSFGSHFGSKLEDPFSENTNCFNIPSLNGASLNGTSLKFMLPTGTDTMMKGGVQTNTKTRFQCITCMFEYEGKSLEELRLEDYQANRKGPQYKTCDYDKSKETGFIGRPNSSFGSHFGSKLAEPFSGNTNCFNISSLSGTSLKFMPPMGIDNKSLEELNLEDEKANLIVPQCEIGNINGSKEGCSVSGSTHWTWKTVFAILKSSIFDSSTPSGTTVEFSPLHGMHVEVKNVPVFTRHQCITCMPEYENKSFEELRMEDYAANRKGHQVCNN